MKDESGHTEGLFEDTRELDVFMIMISSGEQRTLKYMSSHF